MRSLRLVLFAVMALLIVSSRVLAASAVEQRSAINNASKGVDIRIIVKDYPNAPVVLGYYYNKQMLVKDTIVTDAHCVATLKQDTLLTEGVYMVYVPERNYFDIVLTDNQHFTLECDTLKNMALRARCSDNEDLREFIDYQKYLSSKNEQYRSLSEKYEQAKGDAARQNQIRQEFKEVKEEVKKYNDDLIERNKTNFLSVFFTALKEVEVPSFADLYPEGTAKRDSLLQVKGYWWYRGHWDMYYDFSDPRLLRTPFFISKVDKYLEESISQEADTVAQECIKIIEKARGNKETFQYWTSHLYNMTNNSKIMGMDGALVQLADKYYLSGEADWASEKFISDLREQVEGLRYTLIGKKAVDLKAMPSVTGEYFTLSEVRAPYTILVFWEPSCGHCKKEIPKLKTEVWDKYKQKGIKVFAVYCQVEKPEWEEFISNNDLDEWINVYDPYGRTKFRKYYNIKSTPQIYILDKDKKIVAKRIGVEQIPDFFDHFLK